MDAPLTVSHANVDHRPTAAIAKEAKHYVAHRPPYPKSMWELWTSYHEGPLTSAHDIGAGSGNGVEGLLRHLSTPLTHVVLTEPQAVNVKDCRARFEDRFPNTTFTYRNCRREDPWEPPAGLKKLDFVMACESLHWTILEPTLNNISASLRENGTFAAVIYGPFPVINNSATAKLAFKDFITEHGARLLKHEWMNENWKRAARQMFHGMECVPLRDERWKDVKRIDINCHDGWHAQDYQTPEGITDPVGDQGKCERVTIEDSRDWQISATVGWLKQSLESMRFGFTEESWTSPKWQEIENEIGDGTLELIWQVQMVLARKRG